jgi:hypothetical protein
MYSKILQAFVTHSTFLAIILLLLLFISCNKESNPVDPNSSTSFLGAVGSERGYYTTEWWFKERSSLPYWVVPDSILPYVSLSDTLRRSGVVKTLDGSETVELMDSEYYNNWHFPQPCSVYRMTREFGYAYDLIEELHALHEHQKYHQAYSIKVNEWYETRTQIERLQPELPLTKGLPWVKKPVQLNDTWIRYQFNDTLTGKYIHKIIAHVESYDTISVKAGKFIAYKLTFINDYLGRRDSLPVIEYWTSNVGLILSISDYPSYLYSCYYPLSGETDYYQIRRVIRRELTSVNIVY